MKNSRSNIDKRQDQIMNYLLSHREADVQTLAALLDISEITVRRDLDVIASKGLAERYFGGIRLIAPTVEPSLPAAQPATALDSMKENLAARAAAMIEPHDVVFINSSSTAMRVLKLWAKRNP